EKAVRANDEISIKDDTLALGQHVRKPGAEIMAGAIPLEAGHLMNPASVSFLSAIGVSLVSVYPSPIVTIIVTGNEFQSSAEAPVWGKVYESNSAGLRAALQQAGISTINILYCRDDLNDTVTAMQKAIDGSNLVLLTGGVSVGEYDFVVAAAEKCGVLQHFHRVKQKPGKPLYFGTVADAVVFGLPGNPSSVLTCFYEYVLEAISYLTKRPVKLKQRHVRLQGHYTKAAGLTHFLKARYEDDVVFALSAQESFRLASFATANCLLVAEESVTEIAENSIVNIHLLP
ncbi:MAG: molybdopterin molybdenumtransferase MoeA, partial [Chitinophagaceae bacterium]